MKIIDEKSLLTSAQKSSLKACARAPFMLGDYRSLDDIVTKLNVDVHIEPGIPERSMDDYYEKAIEYLKKVLKQIRERMHKDEYLNDEYRKASNKLERLYSERQAHSSMRLLGLYDSQQNIIKLFPEAMADADASKMDEYLVSTFAHEVMHAYFNRPGHKKFPYAMFVEEPLAEFGKLLYLHETHSQYYDWAYDNVSSKKCCYGYGANIMDQYLGGDKSLNKYLEEYKIPIGEYEMLDESNGRVSMPKEGDFVEIAGQPFVAEWTPVYSVPPTYFWDDTTKTLGLNGDWRGMKIIDDVLKLRICISPCDKIQHLHIGKDFIEDGHCTELKAIFRDIPTTVSPQHKVLTSINGILVKKDDYKGIVSLSDGYYKLKRNGKWCLIDPKLNLITPFKYDFIWDFDENELSKVEIDYKYGLVNKQGKEQVPVIYEGISKERDYSKENSFLYTVAQNGKCAMIDSNNTQIIQPKYDEIWWFSKNGLCKVRIGKHWGLVNKQGEEQIPVMYEEIRRMADSSKERSLYFKVFLNNKWGIIDFNNNQIIQFKYDESICCRDEFDENGLCEVKIGKKWGLVNKQGVEQVPLEYEDSFIRKEIKYMWNGEITRVELYYKVKQKGEVFVIDKYGNKQPEEEI